MKEFVESGGEYKFMVNDAGNLMTKYKVIDGDPDNLVWCEYRMAHPLLIPELIKANRMTENTAKQIERIMKYKKNQL